jgi:hypothetical protein
MLTLISHFAVVDVRDRSQQSISEKPDSSENAIPLPDIREVRQKKAMQEELERLAEEDAETRVKIKRGDTKALRDVSCCCWLSLMGVACFYNISN